MLMRNVLKNASMLVIGVLSVSLIGCSEAPETLASTGAQSESVNVAMISPVVSTNAPAFSTSAASVIKASYVTPVSDKVVIDNSACSISFCPLPLYKRQSAN